MKKVKIALGALGIAALSVGVLWAADHIDAPAVAGTSSDITDYYAFQSPQNNDNMVFVANVQGLLDPITTANANFDEQVMVEFNIDNTGDLVEDLVIQAIVENGVVKIYGPIAPSSNGKTSIKQTINSLWRPYNQSLNYLLYPDQWKVNQWNNFIETKVEHRYTYGNSSQGHITSRLRNPLFWSNYSYGFLNLEAVNDNRFSKFNWRTRCFAQLGLGDNWAPESKLWSAGANPEQIMQSSATCYEKC